MNLRLIISKNFTGWVLFFTCLIAVGACGPKTTKETPAPVDTLILGAYTVPKEAYQKDIIPAFQQYWKTKTCREVMFEQSYIGSGAQSRAIAGGFEADIAALSLEGDIDQIVKAGLITHDWKNCLWNRFITRSVVVIGFRPGNPKNIRDWADLTREDIDVLCPNPKTSGGAQWFINAIYGGELLRTERETGTRDEAAARDLLKRITARIKVMNKSGRESVTTFERDVGDAILTYENEALLRQKEGREFPFIIPRATILIENPAAVVDVNVDKHGVRELAVEFIRFLHTDQSQRAFARHGFRPVSEITAGEFESKYPVPELLFDIDYLGGWDTVNREIYGPDGTWTAISRELARETD